jgi:hypothetical protein
LIYRFARNSSSRGLRRGDGAARAPSTHPADLPAAALKGHFTLHRTATRAALGVAPEHLVAFGAAVEAGLAVTLDPRSCFHGNIVSWTPGGAVSIIVSRLRTAVNIKALAAAGNAGLP